MKAGNERNTFGGCRRHERARTGGRILIVDDTEAIRRLLTVLLEDDGYVVTTASVRAEAELLLSESNFDLVITDAFSKDGDSALHETAGLLAAAGETPVALFSAHRIDPESVIAAGFADMLPKPFDIDELTQRIRGLLSVTSYQARQ